MPSKNGIGMGVSSLIGVGAAVGWRRSRGTAAPCWLSPIPQSLFTGVPSGIRTSFDADMPYPCVGCISRPLTSSIASSFRALEGDPRPVAQTTGSRAPRACRCSRCRSRRGSGQTP